MFVHVKGIKVLKVHTVPSKVTVGSTFGLRGNVINNSTATIIFANGTCASSLSVTFDKNAMSEPQICQPTLLMQMDHTLSNLNKSTMN